MDMYLEYVIRCKTCDGIIAGLSRDYNAMISSNYSKEEALTALGLTDYCCRNAMKNPTKVPFNMENRRVIEGFETVSDATQPDVQLESKGQPIFHSCMSSIFPRSLNQTPTNQNPLTQRVPAMGLLGPMSRPGLGTPQPGSGAPQSTSLQPGLGSLSLGLGAPRPTSLQPGLGAPRPTSLQPGLGAPRPTSLQPGLGSLQPTSLQPGLGSLQPTSLQPGLGSLQPTSLQPGLGSLQPTSLQPGLGSRLLIQPVLAPSQMVPDISLDHELLSIPVRVTETTEFKEPTAVGVPVINSNPSIPRTTIYVGYKMRCEVLNGRTYLAQ